MRFVKVVCAAALAAVVVVPTASAFRFSDHTRLMPVGVVGQPFSHPVETVAGCKGVYVIVHGNLPPGLRLVGDKRDLVDGSNWRIEGTPTTAGAFSFWLIAKNLCPADSTEEDFTIRVVGAAPSSPPPPRLAITTTGLPIARIGAAYAVRLAALSGGHQRWSIASGGLPTGLRLTSDGLIVGRAARTARSTWVTVAVSDGAGRRATRTFTVAVRSRVAIATRQLPLLRQGRSYVLRLYATGGASVMRWKIVRGHLPIGLRLNTLHGKLIGRPRHTGRYRMTVRVRDALGSVATRTLVLRVRR